LYGIKVKSTDDPYLKLAEGVAIVGGVAANVGSFLVDTIPMREFI
jgi:hypothetical protein